MRRFLARITLLLAALGFVAGAAVRADPPAAPKGGMAIPASRVADRVAVISVHGPIDEMTLKTLERRIQAARADGCTAVVFEFDTPGGELTTTFAISHLIRNQAPTNNAAWVRPNAFSAGAILALGCAEILVTPDGAIGDAAPIAIVPGIGLEPMPLAERAKMEAPVLMEVTGGALRNGYDVRLARAMVHVEDELWLLERDDGERIFANADEYRILFGADPPRGAGGYVPDTAPRTLPPIGSLERDEVELEMFVHSPRVAASEAGRWTLLGQVDTATELVTLRGDEARRYGLASATIANEDDLKAHFGASTIVRYDESWSESLVRFLVSWPVRGILIVVLLVSFFIEVAAPGFGLFGTVAACAFLILIGAPMIAGLAQWWEVLLVLLGVLLIAVELLVLPGMGVIGVVGAILLLVGLVFTFVGGDLASPQSQSNLLVGLFATIGSFIVAGAALAAIARHLPQNRIFGRLMLQTSVNESAAPLMVPLGPAPPAVGARGVAVTPLRPSGRARFGDAIIDVRTTGAWVDADATIRLVSIDALGGIVEDAST
jgi:membrane-bound serine protease (ClpP class)